MPSIVPVGIDLGTTYSLTAHLDAEGETKVHSVDGASCLVPSVAYFADNEVLIGSDAWAAAEEDPTRLAKNAKRELGAALCEDEVGGRRYPPEVIQGCILRKLKRQIVSAVGEDFRAVITVPAYFDELRRKATADAGLMSGLPVLDILNEPTAAALAFGERLGYLTPEGAPNETVRVLVYDLGGGTFDVTVIELAPDAVTTLATDGDFKLGGLDWDDRLVALALDRHRALNPTAGEIDAADMLALRCAAQLAKHRLTDEVITSLEASISGLDLRLPVTRNEFEERTADLLERTIFTTRRALQDAGLLWTDIDRVLLVGGSTRMPAVRRAVSEAAGILPEDSVSPDEAVARGAAIFARFLLGSTGIGGVPPSLKVTDVNAHGLGIEGVNMETLREENAILIPRNTPLPFEVTRSFVTKTSGQKSVKVKILEGDSSLPSQCSGLAEAAIRNLPPGLPRGSKIRVRYRFERNGRLSVDATLPGFGTPAKIELTRLRGLRESHLARWKQIVCNDGGYNRFEDAIADLMASSALDTLAEPAAQARKPDPAPVMGARPKVNLEPAVEQGAPRAASDHLQQFPATDLPRPGASGDNAGAGEAIEFEEASLVPSISGRARGRSTSLVVVVLGHLIAPIVGLAIGYYLLCWARPDLNFLEIDLPGLNSTSQP